ncbi:hypothetical protein GSF37_003579 [Salmonella enterica subsp. enterica]|nr:hypothetical protein [Salmonella enterica subsp. enterica serovar Mississippi]EDY3454630.1 hypothetical protein [Salmonella enterica subsp. enterica serovar Mississippi]
MVINYKQMRNKREQIKEKLRSMQDLTPMISLAQSILDAYEISLELPSDTWTDTEGNRHRYVSCGTSAPGQFTQMPLSQIPSVLPKRRGGNEEKVFSFIIETVIDDTPGEVASIFTPMTITESSDNELIISVNGSTVPLKENGSPYATVCEAIQYHVLGEIEALCIDGSRKMVQLWG